MSFGVTTQLGAESDLKRNLITSATAAAVLSALTLLIIYLSDFFVKPAGNRKYKKSVRFGSICSYDNAFRRNRNSSKRYAYCRTDARLYSRPLALLYFNVRFGACVFTFRLRLRRKFRLRFGRRYRSDSNYCRRRASILRKTQKICVKRTFFGKNHFADFESAKFLYPIANKQYATWFINEASALCDKFKVR